MIRTVLTILTGVLLVLSAAAADEAWETRTSQPFRIHYLHTDERTAENLEKLLQRSYSELSLHLETTLSRPVDVFIAPSNRAFARLTGERIPHWGEGVADPGRSVIVLKSPHISSNYETFPSLVRHELIHIMVGQAMPDLRRLPRWFSEGIAIYFSNDPNFSSGEAISKALVTDSIIPLDEIDEVLTFQTEKARLAYEESFSAVAFLERQYGYEGLLTVLRGLRQGHTMAEVFADFLGVEFIDFEWQWYNYLEDEYRWRFLLQIETYIWVGILGLFLLAGAAIRLRNRRTMKRWEEEEKWSGS